MVVRFGNGVGNDAGEGGEVVFVVRAARGEEGRAVVVAGAEEDGAGGNAGTLGGFGDSSVGDVAGDFDEIESDDGERVFAIANDDGFGVEGILIAMVMGRAGPVMMAPTGGVMSVSAKPTWSSARAVAAMPSKRNVRKGFMGMFLWLVF